jgi:hypothetical protein
MLEKTIVGKSSEPTGMDICKDLRLRAAVIPPLAKAERSPDRDCMGSCMFVCVALCTNGK